MDGARDGRDGAGIRREDAAASLAAAEGTAARMRRRTSWYAVFCAVFGTVFPAGTMVIGLAGSESASTAAMIVMGLTLCVLLAYMLTRPVTAPWFAWVHGAVMLSWGVLYGATMLIGTPLFPGDPAWWVPMSVATGLPFAVAALWVLRTTRRSR